MLPTGGLCKLKVSVVLRPKLTFGAGAKEFENDPEIYINRKNKINRY